MLNDGDVRVQSFMAPVLCTLILGDLLGDDVFDLQTPYDDGRLFIVIGESAAGHLSANTAPTASSMAISTPHQSIINGFGDCSNVIGSLKTKLFIGCDIWAEVGAVRHRLLRQLTLPLSYTDAEAQAIRPRYDERATPRIVVLSPHAEGYLLQAEEFADLIRAGKPIFK